MDVGVAKYDLATITKFQEELHGQYEGEEPESFKTDDNEDTDDKKLQGLSRVSSIYARQFRQTSWHTQLTSQLSCKNSDTPFVYSVNNTYHFLKYAYATFQVPAMQLKEKYRGTYQIALTPYVGHNMIISGHVDVDNSKFGYFDSHILDIKSQYHYGKNREHYDMMVGNVDILTKWADRLPEYNIQVPLPFDCARDPSHAFPLIYTNTNSIIDIHLNVRNKIVELLRMRRLTERKIEVPETKIIDGKPTKVMTPKIETYWKEIPCNLEYLEGINAHGTIKKPEVWARYAYLTDKEVEWWKECNGKVEEVSDVANPQDSEKYKMIHREYYIDDYIHIDADNENSYGEVASVLLNGVHPSKKIYFFAENISSRRNRNYSNYTTNTDEQTKGWDPCLKYTLAHGDTKRIDNMDNIHSSNVEPFYHEECCPRDVGYHVISFANFDNSLDADLGITMNSGKTKFSVRLGNSDPMLKPVVSEESRYEEQDNIYQEEFQKQRNSPKFLLRVRMLVTRKIEFVYNKKTGQYKFHVH